MNRYNKISVTSSLRNYWRILRMHVFDIANQDFELRERRNIRNVRY